MGRELSQTFIAVDPRGKILVDREAGLASSPVTRIGRRHNICNPTEWPANNRKLQEGTKRSGLSTLCDLMRVGGVMSPRYFGRLFYDA